MAATPFAQEVAISTYRVTLDVFEGPLDLLLRLIEREELDVTKVSLALVADQYLAHIAVLREVSAGHLADFLVIAARLLLIKSRSLLPRAEEEEEDEEDPGDQLARQLLEYKRYKGVAGRLREIEREGLHAYPRIAPAPHIERRLEPGQATLADLLVALKQALAAHPAIPPVDNMVPPTVIRIADCVQRIERLLERQACIGFSALLRGARSRLEIIVTFLAVLELMKRQRLRALQETAFGEIRLEARQPDAGADAPPLDLSEYGEEA